MPSKIATLGKRKIFIEIFYVYVLMSQIFISIILKWKLSANFKENLDVS